MSGVFDDIVAVENLTKTNTTATSNTITWNAASLPDYAELERYRIYRDTDVGTVRADYSEIGTRDPGETEFVDTGLDNGTTYHYRVGADVVIPAIDVDTARATDVGFDTATLNGELVSLEDAVSADVAFEYREIGGGAWTSTTTQTLGFPQSFDESVTGLSEGTSYEARATGDADGITDTGPTVTWTTAAVLDHIAYGDDSGNTYIHDINDWSLLYTAATNGGANTNDGDYSPNGAQLAVGDANPQANVFRTSDYTLIETPDGNQFDIISVAYSPDGGELTIGGLDDYIHVYDTSDWSNTQEINNGERPYSLAYSPGGDYVATLDGSNIRIYDTGSWTEETTLTESNGSVADVAFSPDGQYVAYCGDEDAFVHSVPDWTFQQRLNTNNRVSNAIAFSPDSGKIVYGDDEEVVVRNTSDWSFVTAFQDPSDGDDVNDLEFFGDGTILGTAADDENVYIHDTSNWFLEQTLTEAAGGGGVDWVTFSPV